MNKGTALTLGFGIILIGGLLLTSGVRNRSLGEVLAGETSLAAEPSPTGSGGSGGTAPAPGTVGESQAGGGASAPSPQQVGAAAITGSTVGQMALDFFTKKYGRNAAAGIVGNLQQESGFNTGGDGLAQWIGARKAGLQAFAKRYKSSPGAASTQLAYLDYELRTSERGTLNVLLKAQSPTEAARIFSEKFERPGKPMLANREKYAEQWARSHPRARSRPSRPTSSHPQKRR